MPQLISKFQTLEANTQAHRIAKTFPKTSIIVIFPPKGLKESDDDGGEAFRLSLALCGQQIRIRTQEVKEVDEPEAKRDGYQVPTSGQGSQILEKAPD